MPNKHGFMPDGLNQKLIFAISKLNCSEEELPPLGKEYHYGEQ